MSSIVRVCPSCKRMGLHTELSEEQTARLAGTVFAGADGAARWRRQALYCLACGMASITLWPFRGNLPALLEALGFEPTRHEPLNGEDMR